MLEMNKNLKKQTNKQTKSPKPSKETVKIYTTLVDSYFEILMLLLTARFLFTLQNGWLLPLMLPFRRILDSCEGWKAEYCWVYLDSISFLISCIYSNSKEDDFIPQTDTILKINPFNTGRGILSKPGWEMSFLQWPWPPGRCLSWTLLKGKFFNSGSACVKVFLVFPTKKTSSTSSLFKTLSLEQVGLCSSES